MIRASRIRQGQKIKKKNQRNQTIYVFFCFSNYCRVVKANPVDHVGCGARFRRKFLGRFRELKSDLSVSGTTGDNDSKRFPSNYEVCPENSAEVLKADATNTDTIVKPYNEANDVKLCQRINRDSWFSIIFSKDMKYTAGKQIQEK